jgi:spoIIIJ-associated protein
MEEIIEETLRPILELMHISFDKISVDTEEDQEHHYNINIQTDEARHLIGYHGGTLHAIQHLLKVLLSKKAEHMFSVTLDVDNYRKKQADNVIQIAEEKVDLVRNDRAPRRLPPMSPYFRRLVHLHLTQPEFEDVATASEGEGNYRAVVIKTTA